MVTYPNDWQEGTIGDLFNVAAGGDVKKRWFSKYRNQSHPYEIFSNGIENRGLYGYTSTAIYAGNAVTVTARGTIGQAFYRENDFDAIIRLLVLSPKNDDTKPKFYEYFINSQVVFEKENTGVPQLTAPKIKEKTVPILSGKEQKAIMAALSSFDAYIDDLAELIEKKKGIRDGALEELVAGTFTVDGQKVNWITTELSEVAFYNKCRTTAEKNRYISTENMRQNFSGIEPYKGLNSVEGCQFDKNDTLMANIRPYLKKIWFADFSGCCSADVLVIKAKAEIEARLLYYLLANDHFISYVMTGGIKGLKMPRGDKKYIMQYPILVPIDREIQAVIANSLAAMDEEIESLEIERDKMIQIREGAMDDLLTGRVRLSI